jgi:hypothetical protein
VREKEREKKLDVTLGRGKFFDVSLHKQRVFNRESRLWIDYTASQNLPIKREKIKIV